MSFIEKFADLVNMIQLMLEMDFCQKNYGESRSKISLQKHKYRAEHWIVVSGTAKVTNDDKTYLVKKNESTYIPLEQFIFLRTLRKKKQN